MKKLLSVVLCALMIAALLPMNLHTAIAEDETSGQCGDTLYWSFSESTGKLTITGSGAMYDYTQMSGGRAPWYSYYGDIRSAELPSGLTRIGDNAFYNCVMLRTVTIPEGVTAIGAYAFMYCPLKENLVLPESLTSIGEHAFDAADIWYVTVPAAVASIGDGAFSDCINLREIRTDADNAYYTAVGGVLFNKDKTELITYPAGRQQSSYSVPDGVRTIRPYACGCAPFTTLTFADTVVEIGEWAFFGCNSLKKVTFGNGVTTIGINAFRSCTSLETVFISRSVASIHTGAFPACGKLTAFTVDAENPYFASADGVILSKDRTRIVLFPTGKDGHYEVPDGVSCIGERAFYWNCTMSKLTSIWLPLSVTRVEYEAFGMGTPLNDVYYEGSQTDRQTLLTIGDHNTRLLNAEWHYDSAGSDPGLSGQCGDDLYWSFDEETGVLTITGSGKMWDFEGGDMPWHDATIEYIDNKNGAALRDDPYVSLIRYIELPEGLTSIASGAFAGALIESVEIPGTVRNILYMAFADCENLKSIAIPDGVDTIAWCCFESCTALKTVTIPASVTSVCEGAFWDCSAITDVCYLGTENDRNANLEIDPSENEYLLNAEWHYLTEVVDCTVEWNAEDVEYRGSTPYVVANGSAQTPRFTVKNSADGSVVDLANYDFEYQENTNAGTGYVIVTFKGDYSGTAQGWFKIYLPATTDTKVENVKDGIKVTWDPVEGAAGYVIYRRAWSSTTNGWTTFERWNNTTDTTYIDGADANHKVYAGSRYQYGVKAYFARRTDPVSGATIGGNVGDNYNLGEVGPLKTTVRITTRKLVQVRPGSGTMTVKWEASKNFTGYQIKYATDANFTKNVVAFKIDNPTTYWTTIKGLKSNTTYYVCIRSYHEFNGMTYFGEWSNVLSGKVK